MKRQLLCRVTLPGDPKSKERPRVVPRGGKLVGVTPAATRAAEEAIGWQLKAACPGLAPVRGPVAVRLTFHCAPCRTAHQRDGDNMEKLCLDAANGILWHDDRQVILSSRRVVRDSPEPRTELAVYLLTNDAPSGRMNL